MMWLWQIKRICQWRWWQADQERTKWWLDVDRLVGHKKFKFFFLFIFWSFKCKSLVKSELNYESFIDFIIFFWFILTSKLIGCKTNYLLLVRGLKIIRLFFQSGPDLSSFSTSRARACSFPVGPSKWLDKPFAYGGPLSLPISSWFLKNIIQPSETAPSNHENFSSRFCCFWHG